MIVKTPSLVILCCWWEDPSIFRLLDSLPEHLPKIVVDGKFKAVIGNNPLSSDALRNKVKSYPNVLLIDAPNLSETDKRNVSLEWAQDYKYALVLDSDEYVKAANWDRFFDKIHLLPTGFKHILMEFDQTSLYANPRLIIDPKNWYHYKAHCIYKNNITGEIEHNTDHRDDFLDEDTLIIGHDNTLRSAEREQLSLEYEKWIINHEKDVRNQYANNELR
jgi:hypothetical protein